MTQLEDLTNLPMPEGLPDLTDAEIATRFPLAVMLVAIQAAQNPYLVDFLANPVNAELLGPLRDFETWVHEQMALNNNDQDTWFHYLSGGKMKLIEGAWATYDPENLITDIDVRWMPGDELMGAWLWFRFLQERGVLSEEDEARYLNLWIYYLMNDFIDMISSDSGTDSAVAPEQDGASDVW